MNYEQQIEKTIDDLKWLRRVAICNMSKETNPETRGLYLNEVDIYNKAIDLLNEYDLLREYDIDVCSRDF